MRKFLGKKKLCKFLRNYLQKNLGLKIFAQIFVQIFGKKIIADKFAKKLAQIFYGSYLTAWLLYGSTSFQIHCIVNLVKADHPKSCLSWKRLHVASFCPGSCWVISKPGSCLFKTSFLGLPHPGVSTLPPRSIPYSFLSWFFRKDFSLDRWDDHLIFCDRCENYSQ